MPNDFDPADFSGFIRCGVFTTGGARGETTIVLAVRVDGPGEISVGLTLEQRGREIVAILGASGWPALVAAVREAEKRIEQLRAGGKADELAICRFHER